MGDPASRNREAVERDMRCGLVSRERAETVYGYRGAAAAE